MNSTDTYRSSIVAQWRELLRWLAICLVLSVLIGSLVAFFLWALDQVTALQWRNSWMLFLLPIGGVASGWLYYRFGRDCEAGNSLIYAQVKLGSESEARVDRANSQSHDAKVPWHMAPLVLLATLLTHLFGGSAGREGTAVQIGGALASGLAGWLRLTQAETATLLQAGVAGGFGAVFGTPLAATIFALEVVGRGVSKFTSLPACLFSAIVADRVTAWWGIEHTIYQINSDAIRSIEFLTMLKIVAIGVAFGAASWLFLQSIHLISQASRHLIAATWLRPVMGGFIVVAVVWLFDWRQYIGLGVVANPLTPNDVSIVSSFATDGADRFSWLWKILLTAITVGFGFKGGEATPLFYVGSTLGNVVGNFFKLPIDLAAGLGFVAVFASATRTPLACTLMAVEMFAQEATFLQATGLTIYALIACLVATCVRCRAI